MKKGKSILSLILVIAVTALFGMTCVLGLDLKGRWSQHYISGKR